MSAAETPARAELRALFEAGLARVDAERAVSAAVCVEGGALRIAGETLPSGARIFALAVGKAALPMARAFESIAGARIADGLAVAPEPGSLGRLRVLRGAHPVPDARSAAAAREALALAAAAQPGDVLVLLLSGGASSLWGAPVAGLSLEALARLVDGLLRAGAPIQELNAVRRQLTLLAGGRLAAATRAGRVLVLLISDVLGDDPALIGSGPCAGAPGDWSALDALLTRRLGDGVPPEVRRCIERGRAGALDGGLQPGDARLARVRHVCLASNRDAQEAIATAARARGLAVVRIGDALRGEARVLGRRLGALPAALSDGAPRLLLGGGETTVTVTGRGRGGRNQELALAAALALAGRGDATLLAAGSDGVDGPTDAAGAFADGASVARGRRLGLDAARSLDENDSHGFFAVEGGLCVTGPTGTNVMDLVLLRIGEGGC